MYGLDKIRVNRGFDCYTHDGVRQAYDIDCNPCDFDEELMTCLIVSMNGASQKMQTAHWKKLKRQCISPIHSICSTWKATAIRMRICAT